MLPACEPRLCQGGLSDGSPRISPCELDLVGDELLLGMMWQSRKARDLVRDARCVLRQSYRAAIRARIDWEPEEPFHLFTIEVRSAGFMSFGEPAYGMAWDPAKGTRRWNQRLE